MEQEYFRFKVCVFGDGGVGKTTLVKRYLTGLFKDDYLITIGMDFYLKKLKVENKKVSLQIWDFAGEDRFRFLLPSVVSGAAGVIFMYDTTRYVTFKNLNNWMKVFRGATKNTQDQIQTLLVGGKIDLDFKRAVQKEDGGEFANDNDLHGFIELQLQDPSTFLIKEN